MREAIFQINKPATLQKVISILDEFPTRDSGIDFDSDTQGLMILATSMNICYQNCQPQVKWTIPYTSSHHRYDG